MLSTFIALFHASQTALATVSYATRISVILADGILVGFIGHAIYKVKKGRQGRPVSPSYIITLLFRDGMYLLPVRTLAISDFTYTCVRIHVVHVRALQPVCRCIG